MPDPIFYVDRSEIREGKIEELRVAIQELVEFVQTNEAWPFAYSIYISQDGKQMTASRRNPIRHHWNGIWKSQARRSPGSLALLNF